MFPDIVTYKDFFKKLEYDVQRFNDNGNSYSLMDCLLTLNSLPEWIVGDINASEELKNICREKISIMKGWGQFIFDETKLDQLDHQLRFIRLICNNAKHPEKKNAPTIYYHDGESLDMILDAELGCYIVFGNELVRADEFINSVTNFWRNAIEL